MFGLVVVTPPAEEPVSFAEAEEHCRVDGDEEAALLNRCIAAARQVCENRTGRAFVTQTLRFTRHGFPGWKEGNVIALPRPLLRTVTGITYYSGETQITLDAAEYRVLTDFIPGRVEAVDGWPSVDLRLGAVAVTYTAGYGAASAVPASVKQAMLLLIDHWYNHRSAVVVGTSNAALEMAVDALLADEVVPQLAGAYG